MAKIEYDSVQKEIFKSNPVGRAYLEYNDEVGGEPFGYGTGMPVEIYDSVDTQYGGVVGLYHECIKQKKTWEELLGTLGKWDELKTEE